MNVAHRATKGDIMYPQMLPGTKLRVIGPIEINGMKVYRIWDPVKRKVVHECFSWEEVKKRAREIRDGKISVFFGNIPFKKHAL